MMTAILWFLSVVAANFLGFFCGVRRNYHNWEKEDLERRAEYAKHLSDASNAWAKATAEEQKRVIGILKANGLDPLKCGYIVPDLSVSVTSSCAVPFGFEVTP